MANHLRRQIRDAIAVAVTGLASTGARVYQARTRPLPAGEANALTVASATSRSETIEAGSLGAPRVLERRLPVTVTAYAREATSQTVEDTLDAIAAEVEVALAMPCAALAGLAKSITLLEVDLELDDSGDTPAGALAMTFEVFYMHAENAPDVAL